MHDVKFSLGILVLYTQYMTVKLSLGILMVYAPFMT